MFQNDTFKKIGYALLLSILLPACAHKAHHKSASVEHAEAKIEARSGNKTVNGNAHFMLQNGVLTLTAKIEGLKPNSTHGFHIHEIGDCSKDDASSAGGHFSPNAGNQHGSHTNPNRHAGDLGNLKSDKNGVAEVTLTLPGLNLNTEEKAYSVFGRAVVVHADADDFTTQPSGNSGSRIGCGVIQ
jgi:superoxide dismutase, Cu-Zn family